MERESLSAELGPYRGANKLHGLRLYFAYYNF